MTHSFLYVTSFQNGFEMTKIYNFICSAEICTLLINVDWINLYYIKSYQNEVLVSK